MISAWRKFGWGRKASDSSGTAGVAPSAKAISSTSSVWKARRERVQRPARNCALRSPLSSIATGIGASICANCHPFGRTDPSVSSRLFPATINSILVSNQRGIPSSSKECTLIERKSSSTGSEEAWRCNQSVPSASHDGFSWGAPFTVRASKPISGGSLICCGSSGHSNAPVTVALPSVS